MKAKYSAESNSLEEVLVDELKKHYTISKQ